MTHIFFIHIILIYSHIHIMFILFFVSCSVLLDNKKNRESSLFEISKATVKQLKKLNFKKKIPRLNQTHTSPLQLEKNEMFSTKKINCKRQNFFSRLILISRQNHCRLKSSIKILSTAHKPYLPTLHKYTFDFIIMNS